MPPEHRAKCVVCFQSTALRRTLPKTARHLRALMVGHLRDEKSPATYFDAALALRQRNDILLDHIGAPLDPALGERARQLNAEGKSKSPLYRIWEDSVVSTTRTPASVLASGPSSEPRRIVERHVNSKGFPCLVSP